MQGGFLFLCASLLAALFNYLFQIVASQLLSPKEFADLNGWVANLAPFMVVGAVLQYRANFSPASRKIFRKCAVAFCALSVVFIFGWRSEAEPLGLWHSILVVGATVMTSWMMGNAQIRMRFALLAACGMALALSRLGTIFLTSNPGLNEFAFANVVAGGVCLWLLTWKLWNSDEASGVGKSAWIGTALLSIAGTTLPQFDMFLMNHTQAEADFIEFARAGLFGRGVYALTTIAAQWLLPSQIRGRKLSVSVSIPLVAFGLLAFCGLVAYLSPWISTYIFGWKTSPAQDLIFLASSELSLLAVLLVMVQEECAGGQYKRASIILGILALEAALELFLTLPMRHFLTGALILQLSMILILAVVPGRRRNGK